MISLIHQEKEGITIEEICYIFAACKENYDEINLLPNEKKLIIAADGGYDILNEKKITPDIIIGDFDSIESELPLKKSIKYPAEKDETDTFLALNFGFERGYRNFVIFGGIGGRIDHTIANIQLLLWVAKRGGRAFLLSNDAVMTVISNAKISFSDDSNGKISIFAQENSANGVCINGLKYNLENGTILPDFPLGVSNEFIGERAEVSVEKGSLLITWNEKNTSFISNLENFIVK